MKPRSKLLALGMVAMGSIIAATMATPHAEAAPPKPNPFPPINSCGTVDGVVEQDLEGNTFVCLVWHSDKGGAYRFDGIDDYMIGDRVRVQGVICTICSPYCGGATPILNAMDTPCN